jgi:hypothetical protein
MMLLYAAFGAMDRFLFTPDALFKGSRCSKGTEPKPSRSGGREYSAWEQSLFPHLLVPPKILEPIRRHGSVDDRVADRGVAHVVLQRTGVVPIVCELKAASMAQHVGMNVKCHASGFTEPLDKAMKA